jgi:hypothetical protein
VQRACACGTHDEETVARSAAGGTTRAHVPPIVGEVNGSSGKPLDRGTRSQFETAFGWNFANVRIHTDDRAGEAARAVNARAYTSGNHVVFASGEFAPTSADGQRLLAHELAHVVQQSTGAVPAGISRPGDVFEREADHLARRVASGSFVPPGAGSIHPAVHRAPGTAHQAVQRWPGDGMLPPGDCSWARYLVLRGAVEAAKAVVDALGACTVNDSCAVLSTKIAAITVEIAARVALDTTCFRGGDTGHREQVQVKVRMLNNCYRFFAEMDCAAKLAAAAAAAAAAARALAERAAATAAETAVEIEEGATAAGELIEGAAAAGEAVEGGGIILELLPLLLL